MAAQVDIGKDGGTVSVESDLDMLMSTGGGHVTWRISGQPAPEMRRIIDKNYGNNDGNITPAEAALYTSALDNYLTQSAPFYHGGKLNSFSLLDRNRGVEDNSEFLVAKDNDTRTIEIRFLIEATLSQQSDNYKLSDDIMVTALFEALRTSYDTNTYVYVGKVDITHMNYVIGLSSFSNFNVDHGRAIRFRGPCWEIYQYTVSYDGGTQGNAKDTAQYDPFNVLESPLELFIIIVALGYFMLYFPKRFAREGRKQRIKALTRGSWGFILLLLAVYMLGSPGWVVWVLAPLLFCLVFALSYMIYIKNWKGYAKPLSIVESRELDRDEGIVRPESYRKIYEHRDEEEPYDDRPQRPSRAPPQRRQYESYAPEPEAENEPGYSEDEGGPLEEQPEPAPRRAPPRSLPAPSRAPRPQGARPETPRPQAPRPQALRPQAPKPQVAPGPPVISKKIRCVQCKEIFTAEIRTRPQRIECPICGKVGLIK